MSASPNWGLLWGLLGALVAVAAVVGVLLSPRPAQVPSPAVAVVASPSPVTGLPVAARSPRKGGGGIRPVYVLDLALASLGGLVWAVSAVRRSSSRAAKEIG